ADAQLDEDGKVIRQKEGNGKLDDDDGVIILESAARPVGDQEMASEEELHAELAEVQAAKAGAAKSKRGGKARSGGTLNGKRKAPAAGKRRGSGGDETLFE